MDPSSPPRRSNAGRGRRRGSRRARDIPPPEPEIEVEQMSEQQAESDYHAPGFHHSSQAAAAGGYSPEHGESHYSSSYVPSEEPAPVQNPYHQPYMDMFRPPAGYYPPYYPGYQMPPGQPQPPPEQPPPPVHMSGDHSEHAEFRPPPPQYQPYPYPYPYPYPQYQPPPQASSSRQLTDLERKALVVRMAKDMDARPFNGRCTPSEAEAWLQHIESIFEAVPCQPEDQLEFTTRMLKGGAESWWKNIRHYHADQVIDWDLFVQAFRAQFIPSYFKRSQIKAFQDLKHEGDMTVEDYKEKFEELLEYARETVPSEEEKTRKFVDNLDISVLERMKDPHEMTQYNRAVSSALYAEKMRNRRLQLDRSDSVRVDREPEEPVPLRIEPPRNDPTIRSRSPRRKKGLMNLIKKTVSRLTRGSSSGSGRSGGSIPECPRCHRRHQGQCRAGSRACYTCGQEGHFADRCPNRGRQTQTTQPAPARQSFGGQGSSQQATLTRQTSTPHPSGRGRGAGSSGGSQQQPTARVFAMSRQEAQASPDIITGTLYINGSDAFALVDPGSTHSYVSRKITPWLGREAVSLRRPLVVSMPTGDHFAAR